MKSIMITNTVTVRWIPGAGELDMDVDMAARQNSQKVTSAIRMSCRFVLFWFFRLTGQRLA